MKTILSGVRKSMNFKNKVVVITGASRGIGYATALAFAEQDAKLVLGYHTNEAAIKKLEHELSAFQTEFISVSGDLGEESTAQKFLDCTLEKFGTAHILINNAGAILNVGSVSTADFEAGMRVNLLGTILMTQAFTPVLKQNRGANIINVSSTFGMMGAAAVAVYTAAKAGVINYTKSMAVELAPDIRVNAMAPGIIDTDMTTAAGPELIQHFINTTPMKRLGQASEIAKSILFLASDDASFMTGHTLIADGGHILIN